MTNYSVKMDVAGLLAAMPFSIKDLPGHLEANGLPTITYQGVLRWVRDNSIPSDRMAALLKICSMSGCTIDVNDFVVVEPLVEEVADA